MPAAREEWQVVPETLGSYQVSNMGRVRSVDRVVPHGAHSMRLKGRILRPTLGGWGYEFVILSVGGQHRPARVHRLVAEAFVDGRREGLEVCHGDGRKANNRASNLRWDTKSSNSRDQVRHGTHPNASKTHCANGHPYDAPNTYVSRDGHRACRICALRQSLEYRQRKAHATAVTAHP